MWIVGLALTAGALVLSGSRTGWIMGIAGLPLWLRRPHINKVLLTIVAGVALAVSVDVVTHRARLSQRIVEVSSASGTTLGRVYLWRVHISAAADLLGLGHGPEGFQRRWPGWQRSFLEAHPEASSFRSDLRHAHADLVEVLCDFGVVGLLLGLTVMAIALSRGPPRRGPAQAGLVAALVGGFSAPILFFAPTLCLVSICLGLRLGFPRRQSGAKRLVSLGALIVVASISVAAIPLGSRLASESVRSRATIARIEGRFSRAEELALKAVRLDGRNPRAWMERGILCERGNDSRCSREAFSAAARDVPSDAVLSRTTPAARAE
jgi:hypothetical protein